MKTKNLWGQFLPTFCPGREEDTFWETDVLFFVWHLINKTNNLKNAVRQKVQAKKMFLNDISFNWWFLSIMSYCNKAINHWVVLETKKVSVLELETRSDVYWIWFCNFFLSTLSAVQAFTLIRVTQAIEWKQFELGPRGHP